MKCPQKKAFQQQDETSAYWDAIAHTYYDQVLSPLVEGVRNPLIPFIKGLNHERYPNVADFGCGTGTLLLLLCQYFKHVWGIDFSTKMLDIAKERTSECSNVQLELLDMRDLGKLYDTFDIAFMVNAIAVNHDTPGIVLREINKCIHPNGLLAGIFPSFDTVLHLKELTYNKYISEGLSTHLADKKIREEFDKKHKMDEKDAFYSEDGVHIQKFFREEEIKDLIEKAGFTISRVEKVLYPWELCRKFGYGYFPGEDEIWDWFILAQKTTTTGRSE